MNETIGRRSAGPSSGPIGCNAWPRPCPASSIPRPWPSKPSRRARRRSTRMRASSSCCRPTARRWRSRTPAATRRGPSVPGSASRSRPACPRPTRSAPARRCWCARAEELVQRYPELAATPGALVRDSWAAVPLVVDGVLHRRARALVPGTASAFEAPEVAFLRVVADQCAQALHRADLAERERRSTARLRVLAEASRVLAAASLDVASVAGGDGGARSWPTWATPARSPSRRPTVSGWRSRRSTTGIRSGSGSCARWPGRFACGAERGFGEGVRHRDTRC